MKGSAVTDVKTYPAGKGHVQENTSKHQNPCSLIRPIKKMKKSVLNDVKASPAEIYLKDNSSSLSSLIGPIKKVKQTVVNDVKDSPADIDLKENPIGHRTKTMKKSVVNDVKISPAEKAPVENMDLQENHSSVRTTKVARNTVDDVKILPAEKVLQDNSSILRTKKVKESVLNVVKASLVQMELKENSSKCQSLNSFMASPKKMKKSVVNDVKASFEEMDCIPVKHSLVKDEAITVEEAIASVKSHGPTDNAGCFKPKVRAKRENIIVDELINLENAYDGALSPRRNPSRQNHCKATDLFKKQEDQIHKSSHTIPSISDEELARQLHRAMNSSPRISRCLSQNLKLSLL